LPVCSAVRDMGSRFLEEAVRSLRLHHHDEARASFA
jgi:hypothetical protein